MTTPRFVLIGNPENRRITMFQEELAARSLPPAIEISYRDLLTNPSILTELPDEELWIRQESFGENAHVGEALLAWGYEDSVRLGYPAISPALALSPLPHGALYYPRQRHLGFLKLLAGIEEVAQRNVNWRLLSPPSSIAELFDKRSTSKRWRNLGIPTPESLDEVDNYEELRTLVRARGWNSAYVKISCSSSASGLAIYHPGEPDWILTTVERSGGGYYNSLKLRRYQGEQAGEVLSMLLAEGAHVERSCPKARLEGAVFDLRIVTIGSRAAFTVIRHSRHPITNLHLGGWRGDWDLFRKKIGTDVLAEIDASCLQVAKSASCYSLGVDVLVEPDWKTHRVLEANAFGDLLPGLTRKGRSVYGFQIDSLLEKQ